ncbi:MAG: polysaccharide biosynthesis protein [Butyrivibrio sp.]|uniref:putative polysaccharide biosynthesis protein n=1 Tax=Butyrivibrio sp. TaxID=28121 RepID=UPI0025BA5FBE|nr:polysaccharide biosynthesis protein [Butyrivibrio sp.]MBQ6588067.1 polysaccharide biosynthesis protein [Butyrivibrio sp.]
MNNNIGNKEMKKSLLMNAGILAAAGIISKIIGLLYGSPLAAIIGDEGNGYYGTAYEIYTIILLISSYSIPSAMSKIISARLAVGEFKTAQRIFRCALVYVTIVGLIGSLLLFLGADVLAAGRAATVLRFFAPTIFVFGFLGVLRGYFQAQRTMVPSSVSQILEQVFNAIVSVGAAYILTGIAGTQDMSKRAVYGAIGSALGTGSGVLVALLFMLHIYLFNRKEIHKRIDSDQHEVLPDKKIYSMIILIVTPFILSTAIYNLSSSLNATLFSRILMYVRHVDEAQVASMYGIYARKAKVITSLPIALASAAASAMLPEVSALLAKGDKEKASETISKVTKVILLIAIPSAVGLFVLAKPFIMILFPQRASIGEAAYLLQILAITVVFYSLSTISNAVLQGIGRVNTPVVNAFLALIVQTVVLSALLVFTDLGGAALCIVTIVYSLLMCILNSMSLKKSITTSNNFKKTYVLPGIAAVVMGAFAYLSYVLVSFIAYSIGRIQSIGTVAAELKFADYMYTNYFVNLVSAMVAMVVAVIVYFVMLVKIGGASESEIRRIPKAYLLVNVMKKLKIMK